MFDKATSGDRTRNDRFSPCSIRQIKANVDAKRGKVIDTNAKKRPRLCLESYSRMLGRGDTCGNGVVEGEEECDCGMEEQCRNSEPNSCCNWRTCKLNTGKTCSPSQGQVCYEASDGIIVFCYLLWLHADNLADWVGLNLDFIARKQTAISIVNCY